MGAMVETVAEMVVKMDVVAVVATEEVATVDVGAVVDTEVEATRQTGHYLSATKQIRRCLELTFMRLCN